MTETDWLSSTDWQPMLAHLAGKISKRKGRLYICAGLRSIWELLYAESSRQAVEVAERAADGNATKEELDYARWSAECPTFGYDFQAEYIRHFMSDGKYGPGVEKLLELGVYTEADIRGEGRIGKPEMVNRLLNAANIAECSLSPVSDNNIDQYLLDRLTRQAEWPGGWLVREIFGNPFRPLVVQPEWLTWSQGTVPAIARKIYLERSFAQLPILADALEDAGCHDPAVLAHCRHEERHVPGCWVIDALLGAS